MQTTTTGKITMEHVKTIALIDDDPISHLINSKIINLFSAFRIETFMDAEEALDTLAKNAFQKKKLPDYIFLDINMPGMDGWEFMEQFEKLPKPVQESTCVIILSSSPSQLDMDKSKTYKSVKYFISKPLTQDKFQFITERCN
jgi:CheY-like chemotaxis protein